MLWIGLDGAHPQGAQTIAENIRHGFAQPPACRQDKFAEANDLSRLDHGLQIKSVQISVKMLPLLLADMAQQQRVGFLNPLDFRIFLRSFIDIYFITAAVLLFEFGVSAKAQPLKQTEQRDFCAANPLAQLPQRNVTYFAGVVQYICNNLLLLPGERPVVGRKTSFKQWA